MNFDSLRNKFEKLREDWAEILQLTFNSRTNSIPQIWDNSL